MLAAAALAAAGLQARADPPPRTDIRLDQGWRTAADDRNPARFAGFEQPSFDDRSWRVVEVPHNWDAYEGNHLLVHGDRHGTAWYRRTFDLPAEPAGRRHRAGVT